MKWKFFDFFSIDFELEIQNSIYNFCYLFVFLLKSKGVEKKRRILIEPFLPALLTDNILNSHEPKLLRIFSKQNINSIL